MFQRVAPPDRTEGVLWPCVAVVVVVVALVVAVVAVAAAAATAVAAAAAVGVVVGGGGGGTAESVRGSSACPACGSRECAERTVEYKKNNTTPNETRQ